MKTFKRKEVEAITGIPAGRIQFYTERGIIELPIHHPGRGTVREYTEQNVKDLIFIKRLRDKGFELNKVKLMLDKRR